MKKSFKAVLCLMLVLGSLLCLCSCGSKNESTSTEPAPVKQYATGRYEIESVTWEDGTKSSGDQLQEQMEIMGETFVELYSDNTALLCLYGSRMDMEYSENQMWNADSGFMKCEFSVKNGRVTLVYEGTTYIFVKK